MVKFEDIISKFQIEGEITVVKPLGHGTVNHTYEIICGGEYYVLQEMNHFVFQYPTEVMNNLFLVTEYLRDQISKEGRNPDLETLHFIKTDSGNQLFQTEQGNYYRLYRMIYCAEEMKKPTNHLEAYEAGKVLGTFHRRMRDFDVRQLSNTAPRLHDMKKQMTHFLDAVRADICFRTSDCQEQIQFVLKRSKQFNLVREAVANGEIPLRVTHNDTRYSNMLVDEDSKKGICLIDLDTIMPGVSIFDFADAVRAGAATYTEDEKSGDIELDLELYKGFLHAYAYQMGQILTDKEKELTAYAVWLMTMESGMRYLTEYLSGDRNAASFADDRQSLYRAVNQFFLVLDIEEKMEQMQLIAAQIYRKYQLRSEYEKK